ncbi:hypothetical protein EYD00_21725 [Agrobacterium sp. 33MFTa1.1]|nr:hypothetical protein DBL06_01560 [Agrobacterium pusense]PTV77525.1 hypothetical protein DBL06_04520 [Agrobacterium pusense]QBJ16380.1 hypothetical protein EYD00_21725 [Agrobacterium sp. 33MFTa1.1]
MCRWLGACGRRSNHRVKRPEKQFIFLIAIVIMRFVVGSARCFVLKLGLHPLIDDGHPSADAKEVKGEHVEPCYHGRFPSSRELT